VRSGLLILLIGGNYLVKSIELVASDLPVSAWATHRSVVAVDLSLKFSLCGNELVVLRLWRL